MSPRIRSTVITVIAILACLFIVVRLAERGMTFFPSPGMRHTPGEAGLEFENLRIPTADGETISAWWIPAENSDVDIVFFHGNGGNLSLWLPVITEIHHRKWNVLAVDYRGYGTSTGRPSERGLYRDADALLAYFQATLHRPGTRVVFWGRSLGGPVAAYGTRVMTPDGAILERTFASSWALFDRSPLMLVLSAFSSYRFPTARWLEGYAGPVLVMHGDADTVIPYRQGVTLHARLGGRARFATIPGGDHNDLHPSIDEAYWGIVEQFVGDLPAAAR